MGNDKKIFISCVERSTKPNIKKNRLERHIDFVVSRMLKDGSN